MTLFGSLTIFLPWHMEKSSTLKDFADRQNIKFITPPETLKPREEFKSLLSEYHNWIECNQDKSYMEILKRNQSHRTNEDTTWEIRHLMKQMGKGVAAPEEDRVFNWHLTLHLANEIENQRMQADRLLRTLKDRKPLLDGSAEGVDSSVNPLKDLPSFTPDTMLHESHILKIMDAWFGLFGEYLVDNEIFITLDHRILDYIIETWNATTFNDESIADLILRFRMPELSHHNSNEQVDSRHISIESDKLNLLRRHISNICEDPSANIHSIAAWSKDFKLPTSYESQYRFIDISLIHFPNMSDKESFKGNEIIERFYGTTMFLMEEG